MAIPRKLSQLCRPAAFYFVISMIAYVITIMQNLGNINVFSLGVFSCKVTSTLLILLFNLVYILFWTWVLHLICKDGYNNVSWFLVLLPFIFLFIIFGVMMLK